RHLEDAEARERERVGDAVHLGRRDAAQHRDERQRLQIILERHRRYAWCRSLPAARAMRYRPAAAASTGPGVALISLTSSALRYRVASASLPTTSTRDASSPACCAHVRALRISRPMTNPDSHSGTS